MRHESGRGGPQWGEQGLQGWLESESSLVVIGKPWGKLCGSEGLMSVMEIHAWLSVGISSTSGWNKGCPFPHCLCLELVKWINCFLRWDPILVSFPSFQGGFYSSTTGNTSGCLLSRSAAFGIFPDQGSNSCLLHWQADFFFFFFFFTTESPGKLRKYFQWEKPYTKKAHIVWPHLQEMSRAETEGRLTFSRGCRINELGVMAKGFRA